MAWLALKDALPWLVGVLGVVASAAALWFGGAKHGRERERRERTERRLRAIEAATKYAEERAREETARREARQRAVDESLRREQAEIDEAPSQDHADRMVEEGGKWREG